MTGFPIGYYVHHHGEGHRKRALAIAAAAPGRFTLIGCGVSGLEGPFETLELADDRAPDDVSFSGRDHADARPELLHYAPYDNEGVRSRACAVASWIAERRPALMVVDVSVEIAMLARLCATPTLYIRLAGARTDEAHLDAFRGARALLAPYDIRLDDKNAPEWVRSKTTYVSGIASETPDVASRDSIVVAAFGRGGARATPDDLADAARATPKRDWRVIGPMERPLAAPDNLEVLGWIDQPEREVASAGVVVGGAGDGVLGAIAAAARPYVCIPEERPYDEQVSKAGLLKSLGAAVVRPRWPQAGEWPLLLDRARALDTRRIASLHDPRGSANAADFIIRCADE